MKKLLPSLCHGDCFYIIIINAFFHVLFLKIGVHSPLQRKEPKQTHTSARNRINSLISDIYLKMLVCLMTVLCKGDSVLQAVGAA